MLAGALSIVAVWYCFWSETSSPGHRICPMLSQRPPPRLIGCLRLPPSWMGLLSEQIRTVPKLQIDPNSTNQLEANLSIEKHPRARPKACFSRDVGEMWSVWNSKLSSLTWDILWRALLEIGIFKETHEKPMLKPHVTEEGLRTSQASGPCNRWAVSKASALCLSENLTQIWIIWSQVPQSQAGQVRHSWYLPDTRKVEQNWVVLTLGTQKYHGTLQYRNVTQSLFQFWTEIYGHALSWMHIHKDLSRYPRVCSDRLSEDFPEQTRFAFSRSLQTAFQSS